METNIQETVSLTQTVQFDGVTAVRLTASVFSDSNSYNQLSVAVVNTDTYLANLDACRTQIDAFKELFQLREDAVIAAYADKTPVDPAP